jgi:hypothetical protein
MVNSYSQDNINLNAKLFVRQRVITGASSSSNLQASDSAGIVVVDTSVLHTVTLPLASIFPGGFFVYYLCPNAGSVANVAFARTAPNTINRKAANVTLTSDDDWILLVSDGSINWNAFIRA